MYLELSQYINQQGSDNGAILLFLERYRFPGELGNAAVSGALAVLSAVSAAVLAVSLLPHRV